MLVFRRTVTTNSVLDQKDGNQVWQEKHVH